jgi:16S rRNA U1498 N3-methylase RsmE
MRLKLVAKDRSAFERRKVFAATNGSGPFLGWVSETHSQHPGRFFEEFTQAHGKKPSTVSVAIGPEGDFTSAELSALEATGAKPITLGPLVLRTETAALYCLSFINYELQPRTA